MDGRLKIRPKKWGEFQHYKDNSAPTWIKLHKKLLDDFEFQGLPLASRALAPMLWLVASDTPEGIIDANPDKLSFRLRWTGSDLSDALSPLIDKGFFEVIESSIPTLGAVYSETSPENIKQENIPQRIKPTVPLPRDDARSEGKKRKADALQILEFLNGKARRHFRPVAANLKFIEARLVEGVSVQDLKTLTARKCREWLGSDMEKFLRPETLFNATKCQSYLGEIEPEEPGGQPCNAQAATDRSDPPQSHAPADGAPPISHEGSPALH